MTTRSSTSSSSILEMVDVYHADTLAAEDDEETRLTGEDKWERGRRRRSQTFLDGSIDQIGKDDDRLKPGYQTFLHKVVVNGVLIGLWYLFSISISVYNTWMFSHKNLDFPFPLFTTSLHMIVQFALSSLVLLCIPGLRPRRDFLDPHQPADDSPPPSKSDEPLKPLMTPWYYLTRVAPCASATGLDIGLGNTSLKFITLTFYTMCKSSTLGFVLGFAILFKLEKASWKLGAIILVMTIGVIMMVEGETAFSALGFVLLMMASFFSGLRWSLTQMLLRRSPATSNPFSSLFFLTPVMFLVLIIIAIPVEGFGPLKSGLDDLAKARGLYMGILIVLFPGVLAFLMTSSEFALLKRTSVVTLSVCGIFKEVLTIAVAGLTFGDPLSPINISGLVVTITAIAAYNYIRIMKMKRKADRQAQESTEESAPILSIVHPGVEDATEQATTGQLIRQSLSIPRVAPVRPRANSSTKECVPKRVNS